MTDKYQANQTTAAFEQPADMKQEDLEAVRRLRDAFNDIKKQLAKVIVGQEQVIEELLIAIFAGGHCPAGRRARPGQDPDDLHPGQVAVADLQPHPVHPRPHAVRHHRHRGDRGEPQHRARASSSSCQGPIFANVILADEINRTPPKTQAALLEAMQERQVTVGRVRHPLDDPFFVLATQNPIEQEGTYPLPEAQLDRFMFKVFVRYPKFDEEFEIARRTTALLSEDVQPVLRGDQILELQKLVRKVPVGDHIIRYTLALVRQTRIGEPGVPKFIRDWLSWGAVLVPCRT